MGRYTKQDVIDLVRENDVEFIRLQFSDLFGTMKNVAITARQLEKALDNKCTFDGSSVDGFVRIEESDMYLYPDLDSFAIFPWNAGGNRVARLICDVYGQDGLPFAGDPRNVLKRVMVECQKMGYKFNVGPECEFFLFHTDEEGRPTTVSHEIDFKYDNALRTADNILTFKFIVKYIAKRHGLYASFMPKPITGVDGSGMHLNMSLWKNGKNIFADSKNNLGISEEAFHFMAGVMEHANEMCLITNPLVNSYKRIVPGYEAPVDVSWSPSNRSPLIRVPAARGSGTRLEFRSPDSAANPYLALAVSLAAGLDGIKRKLTPGKGSMKNQYEMAEGEKQEAGINTLPRDMKEALEIFKQSTYMKELLGDHIFNKYVEAKSAEWESYQKFVSQWEVDRYLYKI